MERYLGRDVRAVLEVTQELLAASRDPGVMRHTLPAAVGRLIPADVTAYVEVDRRRRSITVTANPDGSIKPAQLHGFVRNMEQYPLFTAYRRGEGSAVKISDFVTHAQFRRSRLYDEFFREIGAEHAIAKGLPGHDALVTAITLLRRRRDFGERDRLVLNLLRPYLNEVFRNARALADVREDARLLEQGVSGVGRGLVVLDASGRVRLMTTRARAWLDAYFGPTRQGQLPDALRRFVQHDGATIENASAPLRQRAPLVVAREGARLTIRILIDGDRRVLALDEESTRPSPDALESLGLTAREKDVLTWIAEGKTNSSIAAILGMSARTVEKHVEHILRKLGVETRTAAAARALAVTD